MIAKMAPPLILGLLVAIGMALLLPGQEPTVIGIHDIGTVTGNSWK